MDDTGIIMCMESYLHTNSWSLGVSIIVYYRLTAADWLHFCQPQTLLDTFYITVLNQCSMQQGTNIYYQPDELVLYIGHI